MTGRMWFDGELGQQPHARQWSGNCRSMAEDDTVSWPKLEQRTPAASDARAASRRLPCALIRHCRRGQHGPVCKCAVRAHKDAHGPTSEADEDPHGHAQHERALQRLLDQQAAFDVGRVGLQGEQQWSAHGRRAAGGSLLATGRLRSSSPGCKLHKRVKQQ